MPERKFVQLCEEILTRPGFDNDYSTNDDTTDTTFYDIFQFDKNGRPVVDYRRARSCPTNPQLFLSDGAEKYSAFLYHPVENGLLRINKADKLTSLGYREQDEVEHTLLT